MLVGSISLGLALIGVLLPGVPTTPFLLLCATCFARASPRLHQRMRDNQWIGPALRDWEQHRSLTLWIKIVALTSMVLMVSLSLWTFRGNLWVQAVLGLAALAGIWIVAWRIPTRASQRSKG